MQFNILQRNVPNVPTVQNVPRNVPQHITLRNIKANYGWGWYEKAALRLISEHYSGAKRLAARSVYVALTEIASDQHTPTKARAACSYIGQRAGVSEGTARRYLHELAALGLLTIDTQARDFNTYHLAAVDIVPSEAITAPTMPLADGKGFSSRPLALAEPRTVAAVEGITGEPQMKKKYSKANKPQQQVVVLADGGISSSTTTDGEVGKLMSNPKVYVEPQIPQSDVDEQTTRAVKALTSIGVRHTVAVKTAADHPLGDIIAWAHYAQRQTTLKTRAGFVLAMLKAGEEPPSPFGSRAQGYQNTDSPAATRQRQAEGLSEASPEEQAETAPADEPSSQHSTFYNPHSAINSALSTQHQALWYAAQEQLREMVSDKAWGMWAKSIQLLKVEGDRAVLYAPTVSNFTQRYAGEVGAALAAALGRTVAVEFVSGWLATMRVAGAPSEAAIDRTGGRNSILGMRWDWREGRQAKSSHSDERCLCIFICSLSSEDNRRRCRNGLRGKQFSGQSTETTIAIGRTVILNRSLCGNSCGLSIRPSFFCRSLLSNNCRCKLFSNRCRHTRIIHSFTSAPLLCV